MSAGGSLEIIVEYAGRIPALLAEKYGLDVCIYRGLATLRADDAGLQQARKSKRTRVEKARCESWALVVP